MDIMQSSTNDGFLRKRVLEHPYTGKVRKVRKRVLTPGIELFKINISEILDF